MSGPKSAQPTFSARYKPDSPNGRKGKVITVLVTEHARACVTLEQATELYHSLGVAIQKGLADGLAKRKQQCEADAVPSVEIP